jgi:spectinomycin phosphotransferase
MLNRPSGVDDEDLAAVLRDGWGVDDPLTYRPVGAGSYHWTAGDRWFVTVDRATSFDLLDRSLRAAHALAGLGFVVAPVPSRDGRVLLPLGPAHAVSVFPLVDGVAGEYERHTDPAPVLDMLIALHAASVDAPRAGLGLPAALRAIWPECDRPWTGGPYSEAARDLINRHRSRIAGWMAEFERLAGLLRGRDDRWVVTHGEPHPGNILRTPTGALRLIDWDTVRIGPPERDLWMLTPGGLEPDPADGDLLAAYRYATGRAVGADGLAFYRLSWRLDEIGVYACDLRREHGTGGDADEAIHELRSYLD